MNRLRSTVENCDTKAGRAFDIVIQIMIITSLASFSVSTLPDLSASVQKILSVLEVISVAIFTVEYLLRLIVAERKLKFIFSFYGLVDLIAILPFYVARGVDLRAVRIFRLFRLVRIFKLMRFDTAIARFAEAFASIRAELAVFFSATLFLLYIAGVGIYYCENAAQPEAFKSIFHSLWWAVVTLTTVGYGDVYPVTLGGRLLTFAILMIGLGVVAVPTGLLSSALSRTFKDAGPER